MSEVLLSWAFRYISHAVGASVFLLPHALARSGGIEFSIVLFMVAYSTRTSLLFVAEMARAQDRPEGIEHTNYFVIVMKYVSPTWRRFVRLIFVVDVVVCSSFYFKMMVVIFISIAVPETPTTQERLAYSFICICATAIILIYVERYLGKKRKVETQINNNNTVVNVEDSNVERIVVGDTSKEMKDSSNGDKINMKAVVGEMYNFDRKRFWLLVLLMLLVFGQFVFSYELWGGEGCLNLPNATIACPGLFQPTTWIRLDDQIFIVCSIIMYAFMNYAIMLPVCMGELRLEEPEYTSLVTKSKLVLMFIYAVFALLGYLTFGESTPVVFLVAYGKNTWGVAFAIIALGMTLNAMLLRIMPCCKLIQVLLFDTDTENDFWVIMILQFLVSMATAYVFSVLHLVIVAGSCTCNLLITIIPCCSYLNFLRQKKKGRVLLIGIARVLPILTLHTGLMLTTVYSLSVADPTIGQYCRNVMNAFWDTK